MDINPNNFSLAVPTTDRFCRSFLELGDWNSANATHFPPMETWIDLNAGVITVDEDDTEVWVGMNNWSMDWKYGMFIDYVELQPLTEQEYLDYKNPPPQPPPQEDQAPARDDNGGQDAGV